jgi:uncharacterized protein with NRDE domain
MISFDRSKPYAEIWGQPGLAYQQDGKNFNGRGELVTDFGSLKHLEEVNKLPTPDDGTVPKCYTQQDNKEEKQTPDSLETMHWQKLKSMLSIYGESYQSREQAINFLKGK